MLAAAAFACGEVFSEASLSGLTCLSGSLCSRGTGWGGGAGFGVATVGCTFRVGDSGSGSFADCCVAGTVVGLDSAVFAVGVGIGTGVAVVAFAV